ncbi:guanine nucleotide-binding protein G(q) subunit alpha-like isoform X2 [Eleginops maclovinus]|uniref:guanine nucleotide-binding protein G(q) subunit alpha-like isoform X2 n=1 Tax=Eleginops maclovinus TaxID=56733 RepID=UPI0030803471
MAGCWPCCPRLCVCCLSEEQKTSIEVDKEIARILKQQKKKERKEIKILLLGTGESGKTTFIRQMRIIHGRGFSEEERRSFAKCIFQNILTAMKAMTGAMTVLKIPYFIPENEIYGKWLQDINTVQISHLERGYVDAIRRLWADSGVRACYSRRCEYQLLDSTEYYMNNLDRISAPDYIPTEQDVLRVRFPTTGIHDYSFTIKTITLSYAQPANETAAAHKATSSFPFSSSSLAGLWMWAVRSRSAGSGFTVLKTSPRSSSWRRSASTTRSWRRERPSTECTRVWLSSTPPSTPLGSSTPPSSSSSTRLTSWLTKS